MAGDRSSTKEKAKDRSSGRGSKQGDAGGRDRPDVGRKDSGRKSADKTSTKRSKDASGSKQRSKDASKAKSKAAGSKDASGSKQRSKDASAKGPRTSRDYSSKELKGSSKDNWRNERRKHTAGAEKAARKDIKQATGKDAKVAGKKVEHHHHAGVKEAKAAKLNPKVAGEKERMTAVHSRKDSKVYGTYGDKADPAKNKRYTHHNVASKIDKAEQARTAKAMGAKGDAPKLPRGDAGRKGLVDSSGTSKWRFPATADQSARKQTKWERKEPAGPKVDAKTGRVIPEKGSAKPDAPKTTGKPDAPRSGGGGKAGDALGKLGKAARIGGVFGNIAGASREVKEIIAREKPEWLPEGSKVELYKPVSRDLPIFQKPSGYTVEKKDGQVIYRGPDGKPVSRDEALRNSESFGDRPIKA